MAINRGTRRFIKHKSRNKTYISNKQLHAIQLYIYHSIKFRVQDLEGKHISRIWQCTESWSWQGEDGQNNWVWVKQHQGRCYGAINGRLLWQLQRRFKIKLQNEDGTFIEYSLALVLTTIPGNLGNLDPVLQCVQVGKVPVAIALQVFRVGIIVDWAHEIPEIATSSKAEDGRNVRWIVNSHWDLATGNDVYN